MARDREMRQDGLEERVVKIRRCAAVVKGGRRFSFNALVVVGDKHGRVASRLRQGQRSAAGRREGHQGRPGDPEAAEARSQLKGDTIPHRVIGRFGGSRVILVPAGPGTGVKAGPGVRDVLEACGIRNILTKVHGSTNPINLVKATIQRLVAAADPRRSCPPARSDAVMDLSTVHQAFTSCKREEARRPRQSAAATARPPRAAARASGPAPAPKMPTPVFEGGQMPLFRRIPKRGFSHRHLGQALPRRQRRRPRQCL